MSQIPRPAEDEYGEFYRTYVDAVPAGDVMADWADLTDRTTELLAELSDERAEFRYKPGKWSIKEVIGHLTDCERFFAARALWFARAEPTALAGFDQDRQIEIAAFDRHALADLLADLAGVRRSNRRLFASFSPEDLARSGVANQQPVTVRALAYITVGHGLHHLAVLEERYAAAFG